MNLVVVLVLLGELFAIEEESAKAVVGGQLKVGIHLDGFKRADFNADLAAHADGDVDIEAGGIELWLADIIRLLVFGLVDVDALWGALFFADLAGDAAPAGFPVAGVLAQEGDDA